MKRSARALRFTAGVAILAAMAAFVVAIVPAYQHESAFASAVERIAFVNATASSSEDTVRSSVIDTAARFGFRVEPSNVEMKRSKGHLRIDVRYKVPIELALYSVNLHFHAGGGE